MVLAEVIAVKAGGVRALDELEVLRVDFGRRPVLPLHLVEDADCEGRV